MRLLLAACLAAFPVSALADSVIVVDDAYARAASPMAKAGGVFMTLRNEGDTDDRLVAADSAASARTEIHTTEMTADGVMKMRELEDGVAVAAGESHLFKRGGDHVMLMGLTGPLEDGATITVTLTFEQAGDVVIEVPVDNAR